MGECIIKMDETFHQVIVGKLTRCENCKHCETTDNYNYCKAWKRETSIDGYCHMGDAND